jgi:hypothetical protein
MTKKEPRNPLYLLLLLASLLFVLTALAYAVVPMLEEKAKQAGGVVPESPFRDALRRDGWRWLLAEVAVMIVLGLASMWLDSRRLRRLQNDPPTGRMPAPDPNSPSAPKVAHEEPRGENPGTLPAD